MNASDIHKLLTALETSTKYTREEKARMAAMWRGTLTELETHNARYRSGHPITCRHVCCC